MPGTSDWTRWPGQHQREEVHAQSSPIHKELAHPHTCKPCQRHHRAVGPWYSLAVLTWLPCSQNEFVSSTHPDVLLVHIVTQQAPGSKPLLTPERQTLQ
jgi:hypothetical protein